MTICKGEFWGITKTSLLLNQAFNENLKGFENVLWYKINDLSHRYYIHKALRIYHTEGADRISKIKYEFKKETIHFENLINEEYYLKKLKQYRLTEYHNICKTGLIIMRASNNESIASKYYALINSSKQSILMSMIYKYKILSTAYMNYFTLKSAIGNFLRRLKGK